MAELYEGRFCVLHESQSGPDYYAVDVESLYDFLFDNDYAPWFCNAAKSTSVRNDSRHLKEFLMQLHTGEAQSPATPNWTWQQRQILGQQYLHNLAEDILNDWDREGHTRKPKIAPRVDTLLRNLTLDGYVYQDSRLESPERTVLDVQEQTGVLETLYTGLGLGNRDTASHHLGLSEEHYLAKKWDDSIGNSRKFLECVLQEVAATHSRRRKGAPLAKSAYEKPVEVRDYLEREGLLEAKENEALAKVYGLLSHTGSHPYMAQSEQARLLRNLALTFSEFALLRLQGFLAQ